MSTIPTVAMPRLDNVPDPTPDVLRQALLLLGVPAEQLPAEAHNDAATAVALHAALLALAQHLTGHLLTSAPLWDLHHGVRSAVSLDLENHCTPGHTPNTFRAAPPRISA